MSGRYRCDHRNLLEDDDSVATGPRCEAQATHTACVPIGAMVCADHKCRCSKPLVSRPAMGAVRPAEITERMANEHHGLKCRILELEAENARLRDALDAAEEALEDRIFNAEAWEVLRKDNARLREAIRDALYYLRHCSACNAGTAEIDLCVALTVKP